MNEETKPTFDEFALLELFGHTKIVGRVSECSMAGGAFLRCDVLPFNGQPGYTRFYSPSAIFSINPISEQMARDLMSQSRFRNEPVSRFELPQIAEKVSESDSSDDADDPQDDDYCPDCRELVNNCTCP
jgi:hypothetical protein